MAKSMINIMNWVLHLFFNRYYYSVGFKTLPPAKVLEMRSWCRFNANYKWTDNYDLNTATLARRMEIHSYRFNKEFYDNVIFSFFNQRDRDLFVLMWKGV